MMNLQVFCVIATKIRNFYRPDFFHQSDEKDVFSQFWLFEEKVYFMIESENDEN